MSNIIKFYWKKESLTHSADNGKSVGKVSSVSGTLWREKDGDNDISSAESGPREKRLKVATDGSSFDMGGEPLYDDDVE